MPTEPDAPDTGVHAREALLRAAYAAYNRQDGEALLALVSEGVDWPDGRARLHGKDELRTYWNRQWEKTRTHDEPVEITDLAPDRSVVRVRQVVRALDGTTISEGSFEHTYRFEGGLIARLDIRDAEASPAKNHFPLMPNQPTPDTELLHAAYAAFNARDIPAALTLMTRDVEWPRAFKGGFVQGPEAIRAYWTEQWSEIDPHVEPVEFYPEEGGRILVKVHQVVRDLAGTTLADEQVGHRFTLEGGLIRRMEVCPLP